MDAMRTQAERRCRATAGVCVYEKMRFRSVLLLISSVVDRVEVATGPQKDTEIHTHAWAP